MVVDDVTAGCLAKISRGDVTAVGVLADHLEENNLVGAKTVRRYWKKYTEVCEWTATADFTRRRNTKRMNVALWRQWVRRRIANLYGRKWKRIPVEKFL